MLRERKLEDIRLVDNTNGSSVNNSGSYDNASLNLVSNTTWFSSQMEVILINQVDTNRVSIINTEQTQKQSSKPVRVPRVQSANKCNANQNMFG